MVSERLAVKTPPDSENLWVYVGPDEIAVPVIHLDPVRVLDEGDYDVIRRAVTLLRAYGYKETPDRLRALLPASPEPPTAEEWERAAKDLVKRLRYVHADPEYQGAWSDSQIGIGPYRGPTYELSAMADLLARAEAARKGGGA